MAVIIRGLSLGLTILLLANTPAAFDGGWGRHPMFKNCPTTITTTSTESVTTTSIESVTTTSTTTTTVVQTSTVTAQPTNGAFCNNTCIPNGSPCNSEGDCTPCCGGAGVFNGIEDVCCINAGNPCDPCQPNVCCGASVGVPCSFKTGNQRFEC
jgi:hypothetical protein